LKSAPVHRPGPADGSPIPGDAECGINHPVFTNLQLTLVILPVLPVALVLFMVFGAVAQPCL